MQEHPYPTCDLPHLGCPCRRPGYDGPYEDSRPCDCDCHLWSVTDKIPHRSSTEETWSPD
jgi:hypothetical protein